MVTLDRDNRVNVNLVEKSANEGRNSLACIGISFLFRHGKRDAVAAVDVPARSPGDRGPPACKQRAFTRSWNHQPKKRAFGLSLGTNTFPLM